MALDGYLAVWRGLEEQIPQVSDWMDPHALASPEAPLLDTMPGIGS
jgi:hypothetical protein